MNDTTAGKGAGGDSGRPKVISVSIKDRKTLHATFMPFLKNGGMFVPTETRYRIGEEIFLLVKLLEEDRQVSVAGTVVWATPKGAQAGRAAGVGVQFRGAEGDALRKRIETYLGGALKSRRTTHTM